MNNKLIFLDIDGTLTEPGSNVPPDSALKAIQEARQNGHKVFLCSGRNPNMLKPVLAYDFDGFVSVNGGYVQVGDEVIYDHPMRREQFEQAIQLLHDQGVFCTVEGRDGAFGDEGIGDFMAKASGGNSELKRWRRAIEESLGIRPMKEYDGQPVYKIIFMCGDLEQIAPAKAALEQDFDFVIQGNSDGIINGEMVNRAFDKGRAIIRVCEYLGKEISDTVGFGDSMNDLEMIQTVGTSVCMDNGAEALKKISTIVCPSVSEDGLAQAFRELGLSNKKDS